MATTLTLSQANPAITEYSNLHKGQSGYYTWSAYKGKLDKYAKDAKIRYHDGGGSNPSVTASTTNVDSIEFNSMCCAYYPYISRGLKGYTTVKYEYPDNLEYIGALSPSDYANLIPGMEVFQGTVTARTHMGVYAGNGKVYQSTAAAPTGISLTYAKDNTSRSGSANWNPNQTGPNLTTMNSLWTLWGWPKNQII